MKIIFRKTPYQLLLLSLFQILFLTAARTQNVGIGQPNPVSRLDVNGNLTVGGTYSGNNAAPADGALIEGDVGIGETTPNAKLHVREPGTSGSVTNVAVLGANVSRRPQLKFSENTGATGMGIEYDGTGSGGQNRINVNNISDNPVMTVESGGDVGIGVADPDHTLEVAGDILFTGDFVNQEMTTAFTQAQHNIAALWAFETPLNSMEISVTVEDGSGVNHSGVYLSGWVQMRTTNLGWVNATGVIHGDLRLQRANDAGFTSGLTTLCTSKTGILGLKITDRNGGSTAVSTMGAQGGSTHLSYMDLNLAPGTYYYRLTFEPRHNGTMISGNVVVEDRCLSAVQVKR